jgi:hypothetical protein
MSKESTTRVVETGYRSLQLMLWTLGPDEWLLFKKLPEYAARKKRRLGEVIQMPLPELDMLAQAL